MKTDIPRVTEILKVYTGYNYVPKDILEKAAAKGTSVHALCAGIAGGSWIPDAMIQDELRGYVVSFNKWAEAQVKEFRIIEKRYYDEALGYSGQVDFVVIGTDGDLYLVDLKTGSTPQKTHPIQMAAYQNLLAGDNIIIKGALLVYLSRTGDFPEIIMLEDLQEQREVFFAALTCWKYFNKKKERKKNGAQV